MIRIIVQFPVLLLLLVPTLGFGFCRLNGPLFKQHLLSLLFPHSISLKLYELALGEGIREGFLVDQNRIDAEKIVQISCGEMHTLVLTSFVFRFSFLNDLTLDREGKRSTNIILQQELKIIFSLILRRSRIFAIFCIVLANLFSNILSFSLSIPFFPSCLISVFTYPQQLVMFMHGDVVMTGGWDLERLRMFYIQGRSTLQLGNESFQLQLVVVIRLLIQVHRI